MRLLVADPIDLEPLDVLSVLGVTIDNRPDLRPEDLPDALEGVGILVVRATSVTEAAIARAKQLNLIVRAGVGVHNIDVAAASERGIYVANCPGKNAAAVAELTLGMMVALDRRIVQSTVELAAGQWRKGEYSHARGLMGARLGIAGLGAVGKEVLDRAKAFGMRVSAWSRSLTPAKAARMDIGFAATLPELAAKSDVLTLHLPRSERTKHIVGREVLEALPEGAFLVNTARQELLDYEALREIAPRRKLRVGLDVFGDEPDGDEGVFNKEILGASVLAATPHIAGQTRQAMRAVAEETAHVIRSFLTEATCPNVLNICATSPARFLVVLRMRDQVGVLAYVLNVLKRHGLNIEEVSNAVFEGARASCIKLRIAGRPTEACLSEIRAFEEVFHVDLVPLPNLA